MNASTKRLSALPQGKILSAQHYNASEGPRPLLAWQPEATGTLRGYHVRHSQAGGFVPPEPPHCKLPGVLHAPRPACPKICPQRAPRSMGTQKDGRRGPRSLVGGGQAANPQNSKRAARPGYISSGAHTCRGNMAALLPT